MNSQSTLINLLEKRVSQSPRMPAYWMQDLTGNWSSISWLDFHKRVESLQRELRGLGVQKGDVLALMAPVRLEWELFCHAILALGAVVAGVDPNESSHNIDAMVKIAGVKFLITDTRRRLKKLNRSMCLTFRNIIVFSDDGDDDDFKTHLMGTVPNELFMAHKETDIYRPFVEPCDNAIIVFTSGSTGTPKGIIYRHHQVACAIDTLSKSYPELQEGECLVAWLPLSNLFQRIVNLCAVTMGAQTYLLENPKDIITVLPRISPHLFIAVPRFYEKVYQGFERQLARLPLPLKSMLNYSLSRAEDDSLRGYLFRKVNAFVFKGFRRVFGARVRYLISGSSAMPQRLLERYKAMGLIVLEAYGQSENIIPIAANRLHCYRFSTVGHVLAGTEVKIAPDHELLIKGEGVFSGYLGCDNRGLFDDEGFLATGDLVESDSDGFLYLTGRKSEVFKLSTGRKILPSVIESTLRRIADIEHVVVFGANRPWLIACMVLDLPQIEKKCCASKKGLTETRTRLTKQIHEAFQPLPYYQHPAGIVLIEKKFSTEGQELTQNLKIRRNKVQTNYAAAIDRLYNEIDNQSSKIHHGPMRIDSTTVLLKIVP